jgi:hypothetical protein
MFKILTGAASTVERELNSLEEKYLLSIEGFSATNERTTVLVKTSAKRY